MSTYQMWLLWNGGESKFQFPILPEEINIQYDGGSASLDIDGLGEATLKRDRGARRISFSSIFPTEKVSGYQREGIANPEVIVSFFDFWMRNNTVLQFVVTGTQIRMFCTVEVFTVSEKGGDIGTIHFNLRLKEYKKTGIRQVNVSELGTAVIDGSGGRIDNREAVRSYTVKTGDYLIKIARETLGDSGRYMEIYELNRDIIKNPNLIYPGQVLKIPER